MDAKAKTVTLGDLGTLLAQPKTFSTGSTGYFASGKLETAQGKYQVTCSIVLVGSKPSGARLAASNGPVRTIKAASK